MLRVVTRVQHSQRSSAMNHYNHLTLVSSCFLLACTSLKKAPEPSMPLVQPNHPAPELVAPAPNKTGSQAINDPVIGQKQGAVQTQSHAKAMLSSWQLSGAIA